MAKDTNTVILTGHLGADPELRHVSSGSAVTELRLAVNNSYTTRDGETKEDTLWIDVTCWGRLAETACEYLSKGSKVLIQGALKGDSWEDQKTGEKRSKVKVLADRVQFLDTRKSQDGGQRSEREDRREPEGRKKWEEPRKPVGQDRRSTPVPRRYTEIPEEDDEDIPF